MDERENPVTEMVTRLLVAALRPAVLAILDEQGLLDASARLDDVEKRMDAVEDEAFDQLGTLIGVVVAEVTSLRDSDVTKTQALADARATIASLMSQLDGAEAAKAQAVLDAVVNALSLDSQADAKRVLGYVDKLKEAVPASQTVPDVPVPPAGEPAEVPTDDSGAAPVEVPQVDPTPEPEPSLEIPVVEGSTGENAAAES